MFEVKVTPEDVNRFVSDAILKSALGEDLTKAVNDAIKKALDGYDSPVKKLVTKAVEDRIQELLKAPENADLINKSIAQHCTDKFLKELLSHSIDKAMRLMRGEY